MPSGSLPGPPRVTDLELLSVRQVAAPPCHRTEQEWGCRRQAAGRAFPGNLSAEPPLSLRVRLRSRHRANHPVQAGTARAAFGGEESRGATGGLLWTQPVI